MKIIIEKTLMLILLISLLLLMLSFNIKSVIVNTLSKVYINNMITNQISNELVSSFPELTERELSTIKNSVVNSNEFNNITELYVDNIVSDILNNQISDVDIKNNVKTILSKHLSSVPQYKEEILKRIDTIDFKNLYKQTLKYTKNIINDDYQNILSIYNTFNSIKTKLILILTIIISNLLIVLLNKSIIKSFKTIAKALTITSIIQILISLGIRGMFIGLDVSSIILISVIEFVLAFILDEIYDKKIKE